MGSGRDRVSFLTLVLLLITLPIIIPRNNLSRIDGYTIFPSNFLQTNGYAKLSGFLTFFPVIQKEPSVNLYPTPRRTPTYTPTRSISPVRTYTLTPTETDYPTQTPTPTYTPKATHTPTPSPSLTSSPTTLPTIGYYALIASKLDCPNSQNGGIHFDGLGGVVIQGGDIFSNACIRVSSIDVIMEPPYRAYCIGDDCYEEYGGGGINPPPIPMTERVDISLLGIPEPYCDGLPFKGSHQGGGMIQPGRYTSIRLNYGDLILEPGLYCLEGDFTVTGGSLTGEEITIYMQNGDFQTSGNSTINLTAPLSVEVPENGILDVLLYLEELSGAYLQGNSASSYIGTIFSPFEYSLIEIGGSGSLLGIYNVQLIAGMIHISAGADIDIIFDPDHGYPK